MVRWSFGDLTPQLLEVPATATPKSAQLGEGTPRPHQMPVVIAEFPQRTTAKEIGDAENAVVEEQEAPHWCCQCLDVTVTAV